VSELKDKFAEFVDAFRDWQNWRDQLRQAKEPHLGWRADPESTANRMELLHQIDEIEKVIRHMNPRLDR
jgi:hypothetical protein